MISCAFGEPGRASHGGFIRDPGCLIEEASGLKNAAGAAGFFTLRPGIHNGAYSADGFIPIRRFPDFTSVIGSAGNESTFSRSFIAE